MRASNGEVLKDGEKERVKSKGVSEGRRDRGRAQERVVRRVR